MGIRKRRIYKELPVVTPISTTKILVTDEITGLMGFADVASLQVTVDGDGLATDADLTDGSIDFVVNSVQFGTGESQPKIEATATTLNISNIPVYASNATALAGGLVVGDIYRGADYIAIVH